MRHGSSCLTWEPARDSTLSRSTSDHDSSNIKTSSHSTVTTSKQQRPIRPFARQWTSWTGNLTNQSSTSEPTAEYANLKYKSRPDSAQGAHRSSSSLDFYDNTQSTSVPRDGSKPQTSQGNGGISVHSSVDNFKALPTRLKAGQGAQQIRPAHHAVEENKLCDASKQPDGGALGPLPLNRAASSIEVNVARSRCHPRRRPCSDNTAAPTPKLRRDTDCTEAIVRLIVFFSTKLVHTIWSQSSVTPKSSKDFNGAGVLPLQVFIQETLRRSKTSYSTLQVALFYLILLRPHVKPCQTAQQQYTPNCRALQCGRRMFLTALILASKYLQDRNYSARAWSKISGLPVAEINENERHYLELIKYNLHMSKETFENWSRVVLSICKASGQGPLGSRPDSPPSSPNGSCSVDADRAGSSSWWLYHLSRLSPDTVKSSTAVEEYLAGLATSTSLADSSLSLDTPPSSPESIDEVLSVQSSPIVHPSLDTGNVPTGIDSLTPSQSPAPIGTVPSRPVPQNLPTPQTTPRYDSAFAFSRRPSQSDVRCRASVQALLGVDRQVLNAANLETCPPPRPRTCMAGTSTASHPLRECVEPSATSWMSSPESSFSDSSSNTTRSRSSSVSSVSSVWSATGQGIRQNDVKQPSVLRMDNQKPLVPAQSQSRVNIGTYSFYHPVSNMNGIAEDSKACAISSAATSHHAFQDPEVAQPELCNNSGKLTDLSDDQIAQLLSSLSSQSDGQIQGRTDPAAIRTSKGSTPAPVAIGPSKKHKRNRSLKEDNTLHDEVRHFLRNEQVQAYVKDDNKPTTYVETSDKEAQYPLQEWAHAKKPVPNALHNKRIALQHPSSPGQKNASELAADFLRHSVAVM